MAAVTASIVQRVGVICTDKIYYIVRIFYIQVNYL